MRNASHFRLASSLAVIAGLAVLTAAALQRDRSMNEVKLITLDPGHFHAALVQKRMYPGVSKRVAVYAPLGFDLTEHLNRIARFNLRTEDPTSWELDIHTGSDFFERMLRERPGNAIVISGRNRGKIDRIKACVEAGLNVLADKPWIITAADLAYADDLKPELHRIWDVITSVMGANSADQVSTPEGREKLKEQLISRAHRASRSAKPRARRSSEERAQRAHGYRKTGSTAFCRTAFLLALLRDLYSTADGTGGQAEQACA